MTSKIYWNTWLEQYQPETDDDGDPARIEPSDMNAKVLADGLSAQNYWTELDDLAGTIVPGLRLANRFCYYRCRIPWEHEDFHTLEVTDLITRDDYELAISRYRDDDDSDAVEQLREMMSEEFD